MVGFVKMIGENVCKGLRTVLVHLSALSLELKEEREDRAGAGQVIGYRAII